MKYRIALAVSLFALSAGSYATTLCQEKEQNILKEIKEISYAEKHQNQNRIDGLNKALSEVRANCSDSQLRADHHKKIAKQKDEVAERQQDLAEAKQKGDADKIAKRERKLAEAQEELKKLEARDY
ncbi:DUF1090 domain-containing protein [Escherichia coli]|nr:DUF1090 domain-containing protein [Escherichia coli]